MRKGVFGVVVAALLTWQAAFVYVRATAPDQVLAASTVAPPPSPAPSPQRALISRYCIGCHNERMKSGNLALDAIDPDHVAAQPQVWGEGDPQGRRGPEPPAGRPAPAAR